MRQPGLRTRLTLVFSLIFAGILVLITGGLYRTLKFSLDENVRQELRERAAGLRGYLRFENGKPRFEYDANDPDEAFFIESSTRYYQIFDAKTGEVIAQSQELDLLSMDSDPEILQSIRRHKSFSDAETGAVRLRFFNELIHEPGGRLYIMQVGTRLDFREAALNQFLYTTLFVVPIGLALAALASWWMAGRALQPVNQLTRAAEKIGISGLDRRLPIRGTGDELDRLSKTFNDMFARLAKAIDEMKQFTASMSHELRTPLTALRGEAEVMLLENRSVEEYRRVLASHLEEYDRLSRLINRLLTLARAESGDIRMRLEPTDLTKFTEYLVEQLEGVAASKQIQLTMKPAGPVNVIVDHDWLETAILNLLDNAIKYTPERGQVTVSVETHGAERMLQIQDSGIGIPANVLPHIFERFYRADPSQNGRQEGAGLGLSLVKWIVSQHQGRIDVKSEPGRGSTFTVWLPAHPEILSPQAQLP